MAVFGHPKRINRSDHDYGPHNVQNIRSNGSRFFANILRFEKDQRLKLGYIAVLELLHIPNCVDRGCGSHKVRKNGKNGTGMVHVRITVHRHVFPLKTVVSI